MTRLALLLVLPLLLLATLGAPAQAAGAGRATRAETYAATAHQATNEQRAGRGLTALKQNACLQRLALRQARRMVATGVLGHQDLGPLLATCGLRTAGENVAYGYRNGRSVVEAGWMRSAGHRANILGTGYRMEGIGAVRAPDGRWWVAQVFGTRS